MVVLDSPTTIYSEDSDWGGIDTEWEEGDLDAADEGVEDTIIVQPAARGLRSAARHEV